MNYSIVDIEQLFRQMVVEDVDLFLSEAAIKFAIYNEFAMAFGLAKLINGGFEKAEALIATVEGMIANDEIDDFERLLTEAQQAASGEMEIWQRALILLRVGKVYFELKRYEEGKRLLKDAIDVAREGERNADPQTSLDSSGTLGEIAEFLGSVKELDEGRVIAASIRNKGKRESVLRRLDSGSS